jgi:two-component system chemotaxis response regulator CheY
MAQILIVDDSVTVRTEVYDFLTSHDLDVATAVDGEDGLSKLSADNSVKLVICDVNMPNMDGLTFAEKVRSELNNNDVLIIMLTTENNPVMKQRGKEAGVKGWIVKPFNGDAVINTIKKWIS